MLNDKSNGIAISNIYHNRSHPYYSLQMQAWLDAQVETLATKSPEQIAAILAQKQNEWRIILENINQQINTIVLP